MSVLSDFIAAGYPRAMSYPAFRTMVAELLANGKVTGEIQSDAMVDYTRMNEVRMNRWEKHLHIPDEAREAVQNIREPQTWLVITEGWCGDSAQSLPIIHQLAALNPKVDLKIVLRDEHLDLMDEFLLNGKRNIPVLLGISQSGQLIFRWGPRPAPAQRLFEELRDANELSAAEVKERVHLWYARDKGEHILHELASLICPVKV